jgi:hypothetical protein
MVLVYTKTRTQMMPQKKGLMVGVPHSRSYKSHSQKMSYGLGGLLTQHVYRPQRTNGSVEKITPLALQLWDVTWGHDEQEREKFRRCERGGLQEGES